VHFSKLKFAVRVWLLASLRVCAAASPNPGATGRFALSPHYWQTLPFYLLIAMAFVGLCAAIHSWRVNQLLLKERKLLKLVHERTAALRESERQLRRSRDTLEIRVHERTLELVRLNHALEGEIRDRRAAEERLTQANESAKREESGGSA
jgi:hypothetical protein